MQISFIFFTKRCENTFQPKPLCKYIEDKCDQIMQSVTKLRNNSLLEVKKKKRINYEIKEVVFLK